MDGIIGKKLGMTQIFNENGEWVPVTVLQLGPCQIVRQKNPKLDGYSAVVVGFEDLAERKVNKPDMGQFKKAGVSPKRHLAEFKTEDLQNWDVGTEYGINIFDGVLTVNVRGISKGRGFAGTVKRHNFGLGPRSHGSKNVREPGSLSAHSYPARVFPGKKMAGQYGNKQVAVKNLKIVKMDSEKNLLFVKGAVPGPKNGLIEVRKS
jgi:large subunit ribosomal protein L3